MSFRFEVGKRLTAFTVILAVFVVGAAVLPTLVVPQRQVGAGPAHPAWNPSELDPEKLAANGTPAPEGNVGTVLFDTSHANRFAREDVASLTSAITQAGGTVEYLTFATDLEKQLAEADVFVIIDPATSYTAAEIDTIQSFVEDGGRLVVLGEPNRRSISVSRFSAGLATKRSRLTALGSAFGISFGTSYLYDMTAEHTDGGFKNVLATPARGTGELVAGIDRVALYTATPVHVNRGRVLLRTAPTAELAGRSTDRGFPVAVVTKDRGVLAVGDTSFLEPGRSSVADNEVLVATIVEFMAAAD